MILFQILTGLLFLLSSASGLVNSNQNGKAEVFRVVGVAGGTQFLPAAYVNTFKRWQIDPDGSKLVPIVNGDSCFARENPSSDRISVQPTLNFLIKSGVPAYVLVGLIATTSAATAKKNDDSSSPRMLQNSNTNHLAQQWTTFAMAAEPKFRIELFLGPGDGTDDRMGVVSSETVNTVVERMGLALSQTDTEEFSSGFHLVSIPVPLDMSHQEAKQSDASRLTCIATAEPDARELLTMDEDMLELTATSKLEMEATQVLESI